MPSLLAQADSEPWIWPFFARLVASFGRTTTENARQALGFWHRYVGAFPETSSGRRELLLATLFLRSKEQDIGQTYARFRVEFDRQIEHVDDKDEAAFLWDRLGHWAQDEANWIEAEFCFRQAYDLRAVTTAIVSGPPSTFSAGLKKACRFCASRPKAFSLMP